MDSFSNFIGGVVLYLGNIAYTLTNTNITTPFTSINLPTPASLLQYYYQYKSAKVYS